MQLWKLKNEGGEKAKNVKKKKDEEEEEEEREKKRRRKLTKGYDLPL